MEISDIFNLLDNNLTLSTMADKLSVELNSLTNFP